MADYVDVSYEGCTALLLIGRRLHRREGREYKITTNTKYKISTMVNTKYPEGFFGSKETKVGNNFSKYEIK